MRKKVRESVSRQKKMIREATAAADGSAAGETGTADNGSTGNNAATNSDTGNKDNAIQKAADKKVVIEKTAIQKVEDYAKECAQRTAENALSSLTGSIKQQSDAKIAALEKEKQAALSSSNFDIFTKTGHRRKV